MENHITIEDQIIDKKYQLIRKLGSGGFGNVWLAKDILINDRLVAIKSLKKSYSLEKTPLIDEMQYLNSLDHPNIVKFFHHIREHDNLYLVMEYCKGGSLNQFRNNKSLPIDQVFQWGFKIAETLEMVHSKSIIHHDIKPDNLLLTEQGIIKIGDFGIANEDFGTICYLAPEQMLTETNHKLDPRIDVYALGLTLLELIIGRNDFFNIGQRELIKRKIQHDFIPNDLERWVQEILLRATHPTPEQRFQTMTEFKDAISSKSVPYHFDANRVKAHTISERAKKLMHLKKWKSAEKLCNEAIKLSPNCVPALIVSGQIQLSLGRTRSAEDLFDRALQINPRANVQKELGWLALQNKLYPRAISMLNDYLQRNSTDFEAYNLLLECFYKNDRYKSGEECCLEILKFAKDIECFSTNYFLFRYISNKISATELQNLCSQENKNPFDQFNLEILTEPIKSFEQSNPKSLKKKLLFHDFRFVNTRSRVNRILVKDVKGIVRSFTKEIISIGSNPTNDLVIDDSSVSRRHLVIINWKSDVWVQDLGSSVGTKLDKGIIRDKSFVNGVYDLEVGRVHLRLYTNDQLLI